MARAAAKAARTEWLGPASGAIVRSGPRTPRRPAKAAREPPLPETVHIELRVWLRLFGLSNRLERLLAARLRREFNTSLSRFDLLAQLQRTGGGLSMSELSAKVMVTNGAVTGLVDKLVSEGWVRRQAHRRDRRTMLVKLTPLGRRNFLKMARRHEEWVIELLGPLPARLKQGLYERLAAVKHKLEGSHL